VLRLRRRSLQWRVMRTLPWAAAVAGLLALGGVSGWWAHGAFDRDASKPELYQLAAGAYRLYTVQQKHPVEVWANEREHLQQWLAKCLNTPFVAPELAQQGYQLVGGRLLSNVSGPAALLLYEGADKQRIVLYVAQSSAWGEGKAAFEAVGDLRTFTWKNGPLWFSLAGNLNPDLMKSMAQSVNRQELADQGPSAYTVARHY
jgi:anti-sigma factor RsiW